MFLYTQLYNVILDPTFFNCMTGGGGGGTNKKSDVFYQNIIFFLVPLKKAMDWHEAQ